MEAEQHVRAAVGGKGARARPLARRRIQKFGRGGVVGAEAGTLTFMAGGDKKAFKAVKPLFEIMGQKAVLCGKNGSGQTAKICNNMILGISMIGVCEAFALADELNLDRQKMFDVVSTSSGQCWSLNTYCPAPNVGPSSPSAKAKASQTPIIDIPRIILLHILAV